MIFCLQIESETLYPLKLIKTQRTHHFHLSFLLWVFIEFSVGKWINKSWKLSVWEIIDWLSFSVSVSGGSFSYPHKKIDFQGISLAFGLCWVFGVTISFLHINMWGFLLLPPERTCKATTSSTCWVLISGPHSWDVVSCRKIKTLEARLHRACLVSCTVSLFSCQLIHFLYQWALLQCFPDWFGFWIWYVILIQKNWMMGHEAQ